MIDLFILILLAWAAFSGWRSGFLKEVVSTFGFVVGLFVAATCYKSFGEYLAINGSETNMLTSLIAFFILWIIVPIVLGLVATMLTKTLKGMKLGMPNSMLGAGVSVIKFLILISCVLNVMSFLHIMDDKKVEESRLYEPVSGALRTFFPKDSLRKGINYLKEKDSDKADTVWVKRNKAVENK